jgi:glycosyltransferase involved in cell wall biosynthesis
MAPKVSVVIPTYNGQRFLGRVLAALAAQSVPPDEYEVIVVDNNSSIDLFAGTGTQEALASLAEKRVSFRCVKEPQQGLTYARIRGARTSNAPLICFLDDDNEPAPEYLASGVSALADPSVGLLVSRVSAVYEKRPPASIVRRAHLLAVNWAMGDAVVRWAPDCKVCPSIGAGLWVRKSILETIASSPRHSLLSDRKGRSLASGGDIEIGIAVGRLGYSRLYVPDLVLRHHIPAERLRSGYFRRLIRGIVRSTVTLDREYLGRQHRRWRSLLELFGCVCLGWLVALRRGDAIREYQFMVVAAWSRVEGPYLRTEPS